MFVNKYAVVVAGGSGTRMGYVMPKQFIEINGKPILQYTIDTFLHAFEDIHIILVLPKDHVERAKDLFQYIPKEKITFVEGGETRFHSVKNGLALVPDDVIVFVHDAVRCLISSELIHKCYNEALENGNAIPAVASIDSIRLITATGNQSIDRQKVQIIQTPQTFQSTILKKGFLQEYNTLFTDEASVVEAMGEKIHLVEGDYNNLKVTRPIDLIIAKEILKTRIPI